MPKSHSIYESVDILAPFLRFWKLKKGWSEIAYRARLDAFHNARTFYAEQEPFSKAFNRIFECRREDVECFQELPDLCDGQGATASDYGEFFIFKRDHENFSMRQMAEHCGLSDKALRELVQRQTLRRSTMLKICSAYRTTPAYIKLYVQQGRAKEDKIGRQANISNVAAFFRSTRTERMMSYRDIREKSRLTNRMMTDLEQERRMGKPVFLVDELSRVFRRNVSDIMNFRPEDEIVVTPMQLQRFTQQSLSQRGWPPYRLSKEGGISEGGVYTLISKKKPLAYDTKTLRAVCKVFETTPRAIATFPN